MSIAEAVLDAVRTEAGKRPGERPIRAGLRIGEISGVEPDSLRFCLEIMAADSDLAPLGFDFEVSPWTRRCRRCGAQFHVVDYNPDCSACGSSETEAAGGDEMEFSYLEFEEPNESTAGTQGPE
jgi:hydrogenase nickel incorporation protein HypA/HybF